MRDRTVETVVCWCDGKVVLLRDGQGPRELISPQLKQGKLGARITSVARGRISGEVCYAVSTGRVSGLFAQTLDTGEEQRLAHDVAARVHDLDFSFGDEAFACAIEGTRGTTSIGVLADDDRGVRTVTEGDAIDRHPRWMPGGGGEILYASAGIGRTKSGAWAGFAPFSLHRLRLSDNSVEVLVADARYDYLAPIPVSDSQIYAIRRLYSPGAHRTSWLDTLSTLVGSAPMPRKVATLAASAGDLVRITPEGVEVLASRMLAFALNEANHVVYSDGASVFQLLLTPSTETRLLATLPNVSQIAIC